MEILTTAIAFLGLLSILVIIHELGHFVMARLSGVRIEEFGLGLPPRLVGKTIAGTIYSLNLLPIGGFVKLAGEDDEQNHHLKSTEGLFRTKSKKIRALILSAGVFMNFFLAVAITAFLLTQGVDEPAGRVHIKHISSHSPASQAGLVVNDIIFKIGDTEIKTTAELIKITNAHKGESLNLTILRAGVEQTVSLVPRLQPPEGEGPMGVAISDLETKYYSPTQAPFIALKINLSRSKEMLASLGTLVSRLIRLAPLQQEIAGPIGIAQVTATVVKLGWKANLEFASILSLNLAVLNILPIPALDGGRLAFLFLEKILGKRFKPAFERSTHQIGMIILILLIVIVSINDLLRLVGNL